MDFLKNKKLSLPFIGFLQALGLVVYCSLVAWLMWGGEKIFGPPYTFVGPTMFLILFVVSALISALLILGYPFILFWEKKETLQALRLVVYSIGWLLLFVLLLIGVLLIY